MNLQFRENVAAWVCFYDRKDVFKGFLERVLRLKEVCAILSSSPLLVYCSTYGKELHALTVVYPYVVFHEVILYYYVYFISGKLTMSVYICF